MKTFAAMTDGVWLNGCAVVLASDATEARQKIDAALLVRGLKPSAEAPYELIEILPGNAVLVWDGDY